MYRIQRYNEWKRREENDRIYGKRG